MKIPIVFLLVISLLVLSKPATSDCGRRCSDQPDVYESVDYNRKRAEQMVNQYFNDFLLSNGFNSVEIENRHNVIVDWARRNTGDSRFYLMDEWELEMYLKIQLMLAADARFQSGVPNAINSVINSYHAAKMAYLADQ